MKKFVVIACVCIALSFFGAYLVVFHGADLSLFAHESATASIRTQGRSVQMERDGLWEDFEIRGVDLGSSVPGHFPTDYAIDKDTYLRWFEQIKDMGANTIRVYMLMGTDFYEAFYQYNKDNPDPLYLVHGVYLDDYAAYSHMDGYDEGYLGSLIESAHAAIDAVHGRHVALGRVEGTGVYARDVSPWVIGYAVGVPWDTRAVAYTDHLSENQADYQGVYVHTKPQASAFEALLACLGDNVLDYESTRYGQQRLIGFVNSPTTDPFRYPEDVSRAFNKHASVDIENIEATDSVLSGLYALYHVYPFDPDFAAHLEPGEAPFSADSDGNTYRPYLRALVEHHTCPVVIGEYGLPSSRGVAFKEEVIGRDQGNLSEEDQARLVVETYRDIVDAGCAGSLVYEWQDEWSRRTWNTVYSTDQLRTPFWSDAQTVDQAYGILAFDPGSERSVCYVDGNDDEWQGIDPVVSANGNQMAVLYDERYLYLKVSGPDVSESTPFYLPFDTTDRSGSTKAELLADGLGRSSILTYQDLESETASVPFEFDRAADFLLVIDGKDKSRLMVQERYDNLRAMMLQTIEGRDPHSATPDADSPLFKTVSMAQTTLSRMALEQPLPTNADGTINAEALQHFEYDLTDAVFESGKLVEGNANPSSSAFDSLADFCFGEGFVEVRIPWQLLNFSDPSKMMIHDDYYTYYGVESYAVDTIYLGIGTAGKEGETLSLQPVALEGWDEAATSHERLKAVYFALRDEWAAEVRR